MSCQRMRAWPSTAGAKRRSSHDAEERGKAMEAEQSIRVGMWNVLEAASPESS